MIINRAQLRGVLDMLKLLDATGSSFLGLEFSSTDLAFYRTSTLGYVRSLNYQPEIRPTIVSYPHLLHCCSEQTGIKGESVALEHDQTGKLWVRSTVDTSEARVHTMIHTAPWETVHQVGEAKTELPLGLFRHVEVKGFGNAQAVLKQNRLMLATEHGAIFRSGMEASASPYPRREFLKAVAGRDLDRLFLTSRGYWGARMGTTEILISGHQQFESLFDQHQCSLPGAPVVVDADRLADALVRAVKWCGNGWIAFDPRIGSLAATDDKQSPSRFNFTTPNQTWPGFRVLSTVAMTLAATLEQGEGETKMWIADDRLRLVRGLWEINARVVRL